MKVICSGMQKTGTKSLSSALRILGFTVYDFEEQFHYLRRDLVKAMTVGGTTEEFRQMFEEVDAFTDFPSCVFWEEIHRAFPNAKIIHTERTNEEEWCKSFMKQMKEIRGNILLRYLLLLTPSGKLMKNYFDHATRSQSCMQPLPIPPIGDVVLNPTLAKLRYRQHNTRVREVVPKHQVLYFNVRDGWEPLCKFLNVPVPNKPFPHRNKGGEIVHEFVDKSYVFKPMRNELFAVLSLTVLALCVVIYFFTG